MKTRVAVIGAGHLGQIHARLLGELPSAEVTAIVDPVESTRTEVARKSHTRAFRTVDEVIHQIDAAIVAAPTTTHHHIGIQLLAQGKHVLMEKPLAITNSEADELVRTARKNQCILQVGHVERFNPAFAAVADRLIEPKYIESRRSGNFTFRSIDVGVVMDLMIHDIDLILNVVNSEVLSVQAFGSSVLTGHEDIAQARLTFRNGCIADLVASRVAIHAERKMNVYCPSAFASIDFANRTVDLVSPSDKIQSRSLAAEETPLHERSQFAQSVLRDLLRHERIDVPDCNPLQNEQRDFLAAIRSQATPQVTGEDGRNAVEIANRIGDAISRHQWNGSAAGPIGPFAFPGPTILPAAPAFSSTYESQRKAG